MIKITKNYIMKKNQKFYIIKITKKLYYEKK